MAVDWEQSYFLTAEQVSLLGLDDISVNERPVSFRDRRIVEALENLTGSDLTLWAQAWDD